MELYSHNVRGNLTTGQAVQLDILNRLISLTLIFCAIPAVPPTVASQM